MILKLLISIFVIFAISRTILRFRDRSFGMFAMIFWILIWCIVVFFVWLPKVSDAVAEILGLGRGIEALLAIAVVILFYAIFRLYVKLEFIEKEITGLVRKLALIAKNGNK